MHKFSGTDNILQAALQAGNGVEPLDGKIAQTFSW